MSKLFSFSYKLRVNKTFAIAYSCVGQAVIVIIIVISVKFEQWWYVISSANNNESLIKTKTGIYFTWFAINELIYKSF